MTAPSLEAVNAALATVDDPEIHRPITDLGMVGDVEISPEGAVKVLILLTVAGCPMKTTIRKSVEDAVSKVEGVTSVDVELGTMTDEQRQALRQKLQGASQERPIPFNQPTNHHHCLCCYLR